MPALSTDITDYSSARSSINTVYSFCKYCTVRLRTDLKGIIDVVAKIKAIKGSLETLVAKLNSIDVLLFRKFE